MEQQVEKVGARARSCAKSLGVINADLLPTCYDGWQRRIACAHRAVEVWCTSVTSSRELLRRSCWREMAVEYVFVLT